MWDFGRMRWDFTEERWDFGRNRWDRRERRKKRINNKNLYLSPILVLLSAGSLSSNNSL
jgi:hypothetical protein